MRGSWYVLVSFVLSGCVGGGGQASLAVPSSEAPPTETGVSGSVVDDSLAPIMNAQVQVDDLAPVLTGPAGEFMVATEPGERRVVAGALGFTSVARTVSVAAGEVVDIQIMLEPLPVIEPYIEPIVFEGYAICGYATPTNVGTAPNPCPLGTPKTTASFNLTSSWRYFVVELVWSTQESFWVSINTPGAGCLNTDPCPGVEIGDSPVRIDGAPNNPSIAKRWALDGKKMYAEGAQPLAASNLYAGLLREELNDTFYSQCGLVYGQAGIAPRLGCPLGVGYSTGIRFQEYISIFHFEAPPKPMDYSALPKG